MHVRLIRTVTFQIGESMLYCYGGSFQGHSHQDKGIPCQDSSYRGVLPNGNALLIVADGVGSSKHSDVASQMAVDSIFTFLKDAEVIDESKLHMAFDFADSSIKKYCVDNDLLPEDHDTTLSVAVFDGSTIIFGHSGDGGIIAIRRSGEYCSLTSPQKGDDGMSVIPLRFGKDYWSFGTETGPFSSVLVMTDGILDGLMMPGILKLSDNPIYVSMVRYFADNNVLDVCKDNIEDIEASRMDFMNGPSCNSISDDRTLVVAIDSDHNPCLLSEEYYSEPDYDALMNKWRQTMYPHLGEQS